MEEFDRYFLLESNDGLKASTHLAATHLSKRFFFQIQLSRLALVRAYIKREQSTLEALLTLGGTGEGFSFPPDRSCDRPDSFLFLFSSSSSSSSFSPPPPFFYFLSLLSYLPPAHNSNALCRRNNGTKVLPGSRVGQDLSRNSCREFCCNFYSIRRRKFVGTHLAALLAQLEQTLSATLFSVFRDVRISRKFINRFLSRKRRRNYLNFSL